MMVRFFFICIHTCPPTSLFSPPHKYHSYISLFGRSTKVLYSFLFHFLSTQHKNFSHPLSLVLILHHLHHLSLARSPESSIGNGKAHSPLVFEVKFLISFDGYYVLIWGYFYPSFNNDVHEIYELLGWYSCNYVYGFLIWWTNLMSVRVRPLPIRLKDHMQKRYMTCYPLLPIEGLSKALSVWVRLGRAKRPHAKEVHDLLSPAAYGGDR